MKTNWKFFPTLFLFLVALPWTHAGNVHLTGGSLTYRYLPGAEAGFQYYEVQLTLYRECMPHNPPIAFDNWVDLFIFDGGDQSLYDQVTLFKGTEHQQPLTVADSCYFLPEMLCAVSTTYTDTLLLPENQSGYDIAWSRCCRTPTVANLHEPAQQGYTFHAYIPPAHFQNSSPQFNQAIPTYACINDPITIDGSALDPDGDSLVYRLTAPLAGGSPEEALPVPTPPPYSTVSWLPGYSGAHPMPGLELDPITGLLQVHPTMQGDYVFALSVLEYRNGYLLNETRREVQLVVFDCLLNYPPKIDVLPHPQALADTLFFFIDEPSCFELRVTDENHPIIENDRISIEAEGTILDHWSAAFNGFQDQPAPQTVSLCWTPPVHYDGPLSSLIYFHTWDDNDCPAPNHTYDSLWVQVLRTPRSAQVYLPNIFSPNGDGQNDLFEISGQFIQEFDLQIFDRLGRVVFQSLDPSTAWDGTLANGQLAPQGVYIFRLEMKGWDGDQIEKWGDITLIR
jgi:gliding motility-associated-like protein